MISIAQPCREKGTRAKARNSEIERCLKMLPDYIFMVDDDVSFPEETIDNLLCLNADLAIAPVPYKNGTLNIEYKNGKLHMAGIACCLIKSSIFEKIEKPYFSSEYRFDDKWNMVKKDIDDNINEDTYFFWKVKRAGSSIAIDEDLICRHSSI